LSVFTEYKESNRLSFSDANRWNNYNVFSLCLHGKQFTCFPGKHKCYMYSNPVFLEYRDHPQQCIKTCAGKCPEFMIKVVGTTPEESEAQVEVEDRLDKLVSSENVSSESTVPIQRQSGVVFSSKVCINGVEMVKAQALVPYSKFRKHASSMDHLRWVQDVKLYVKNNSFNEHIGGRSYSNTPTNGTRVLVISDPITTLLYSEKCFWICIEVHGLCYGVKTGNASRSGTSQNPQTPTPNLTPTKNNKSHVLIV
jgi:hypothetical protein